jgi:hypothetical protein
MTRVLEWLESSFRSGTRLNGLIYLHRIIDPKMQGSALNNIRMFRNLCGPECFQNIILATTFWDDVSAELGTKREQQLKQNDEFWGKMVKKGSKVVRLGTDRESGMKLLMRIAKKEKITLQSQHEMVDQNKSASETAAAQLIYEEMQRQKEEFERKLEEQKQENESRLRAQAIQREEELSAARIRADVEEQKRKTQQILEGLREGERLRLQHERQQRELEIQRENMEKERKRLEESEKRKREALEAQRIVKERLEEERESYYREYSCQRVTVTNMICNKCYKTVEGDWYYRKSFSFLFFFREGIMMLLLLDCAPCFDTCPLLDGAVD